MAALSVLAILVHLILRFALQASPSAYQLPLLATLVFSISGLVMGVLQAQQHFLLPAIAPLLYNAGQIFGLIVLSPRFGINGLAFGVILGALLHLAVQVPALVLFKFRWTPELIVYAIELWHRQHLRLPTTDEWDRAGPNNPSRVTVIRRFGSWNVSGGAAHS